MKKLLMFSLVVFISLHCVAQEAEKLISRVKAKIEQVKDYEASGVMKTNVPFLKVPVANVKIYFRSPDKLKIKNEKGISLIPKGAGGMSLNSLLANQHFTAIPAGTGNVGGIPVKLVKLLPVDENAEIVLSTLYIDEARSLILKARTTTRENGSSELLLEYGKYAAYALPDKATFSFNTREYKLPKGVTFDYDDGSEKKKPAASADDNKGVLEIKYSQYVVNKGVSDAVFK
jgi:hypothetical protein